MEAEIIKNKNEKASQNDVFPGDNAEEIKKFEEITREQQEVFDRAVEMLRTVYDPEIPVNVYDLGLIYKIDYDTQTKTLHVEMTLTAPHCPMADFIMEDVRQKLLSVDGPEKLDLRLVFEPEWTQDRMSEEAKLELGYL